MVTGDPYDRREPRYRDSAIRSDREPGRAPASGYESAPPGYPEGYRDRDSYAAPYREERAVGAPYAGERNVGAAPVRPVGYDSRTETIHHDHDRGFSILSTLMGWGVATFFTLLVTALLGALLGTPTAQEATGLENATLNQAALASIVVLLVSVFIGYFLGGYTAGRMAGTRGGLHGLAIVGWTILVGILAALAGQALAQRFDILAAYAPGVDLAALTVPALLTLLVTLGVMLASSYLGGRVGDRSWDRAESRHVTRHERRGRPL